MRVTAIAPCAAVCLILAGAAAAANAPGRIVSLSPNLTEILYGIGAFGQVVGVSDYSTYPPAARKLPSVGGWPEPDLEKLASLHPDLVVIDEAQGAFVKDNFRQLGLRVVAVPDQTIDDVYRAMAALGQATGHAREAARLETSVREGLARVSRRTAGLPRPSVLLIVDRTPGTLRDLYTAGGGFLAQLVSIAGGRVAAPALKSGYGKLSKEDLLAMDPEIILDLTHDTASRFSAHPLEAWNEMPELKAVRNRRVRVVNEDFVPHASQRIVETAELFLRLIHPEVR